MEESSRDAQSVSLEDFTALGNTLLRQNMIEEAVALFQTASKLFPDSLAVKFSLGRAQELLHKRNLEIEKDLISDIEKERRQDDLLAQQYLSLATLYYSRRKLLNCLELLELSRQKNENNSKTRFLLGKIFYEQGETQSAMQEFLKARDLDPFYEDIYKHLGNLQYQKRQYEDAMRSFVDAYILSGGGDLAKTSYYQRQIRTLMTELKIEEKKQHYNRLFLERRAFFQNLSNSLAIRKEGAFADAPESLEPLLLKFRDIERAEQSSLNILAELKKIPVMQGLNEEELIRVARITSERLLRAEEIIFREEDLTEGIYFIHSGSVRILKRTPFGEQVLASLKAPEFFGEMDFIDSLRCSADGIANEDTTILSLSKTKLEDIFISEKHIAVQFYWHFWKTLAKRIREANEMLKSFFESSLEEVRHAVEETTGVAASFDFDKKIALLKDKGLSSKELRLLAAFSKEEFYQEGQTIFSEGMKGDRLYIVLEGEVRISKFIPGVGEEALAILEKGDFFGEMALIDHSLRSAHAKAHTNTTVLPIESRLLSDILSRDVESSYQFLFILCKILSRRLREMNMKIYQWRIMSGGF